MWRLIVSVFLLAIGGLAAAQQRSDPTVFAVPSGQVALTILTVETDRLFTQSQFGERISQTYTEGRVALQAENRRIADALREEELALAVQRADMDASVFRAEAEAFDSKAQAIRRSQDAKERALDETLSAARDQFLVVTRPILGQVMVDRGAVAILDRRSVLLSLGSIDVTDIAIEQINAAIGDGLLVGPDSEPQVTPEN